MRLWNVRRIWQMTSLPARERRLFPENTRGWATGERESDCAGHRPDSIAFSLILR
jgi:hypothetical protein